MHYLVYHVLYFILHFGSFRKFSGLSTEKLNDSIKAVYYLKAITATAPLMQLKSRSVLIKQLILEDQKEILAKQMTTFRNMENRKSMLGKDDKFCKKSILQMLLTPKRRSQI
jgi:hypothetical protein